MGIVAVQSTPLGKFKEQHTFLKTSEILKIPKTFHSLKSYKSQEDPDTNPDPNPDPNPEDPDNNDPEDPDCAVMCKETSMGFPFCDCQHDVPLRINQGNLLKGIDKRTIRGNFNFFTYALFSVTHFL